MKPTKPYTTLIRSRFSCRAYEDRSLDDSQLQNLNALLGSLPSAPFGSQVRIGLTAASIKDRRALRGLVTYGFIKDAPAFMIGAVKHAAHSMEDYGYLMETAILGTTDFGLGTCWLGGTFSHSSFSEKIGLQADETLPAVSPVGIISTRRYTPADLIRRAARSDSRMAWPELFFEDDFTHPLAQDQAGAYAEALEMVRLGPSASNKQPWRVVRQGGNWHFYLKRTPGYGGGLTSLFVHADLQRVDMGIAMCHFELSANQLGLKGTWQLNQPQINLPGALTEYCVSWVVDPGTTG
jgi:nitroreductase